MYFRVNLKMKKPTPCCCFTWIVFIELNFMVAFLLLKKTKDDLFPGKVGDGGFLKMGGNPSNGGWFGSGGVVMVVPSDEDTCHQNSKPSTLPFLLSSANYHYFHSLMKAPDNPPPPKQFQQQYPNNKSRLLASSWAQTWLITVRFRYYLTEALFI